MSRRRRNNRDVQRAAVALLEKAINPNAMAAFNANRGNTPSAVSMVDAVRALTGQVPSAAGTFGMVPMPRNPLDQVPFGPLHALTPDPFDPARRDTGRPEPRASDYPVAWNLPGNGDRLLPWRILREAADGVDIMRRCIEIRKRHIRGLDSAWAVSEKAIQEVHRGDATLGREDAERKLREQFLPEIKRMEDFWAHPWKSNGWSFGQWLNGVIEDHLVLDAVAIYPRSTYGGDVLDLEVIDATTIKPLLDYRGVRPSPPFPAFQQVLQGFPRGEFVANVEEVRDADGNVIGGKLEGGYLADKLFYGVENVRSTTPYGMSAVENALISAKLYLARQGWMIAEYDDGVGPTLWLVPDGKGQGYGPQNNSIDGMNPSQRQQWEDSLNDLLRGNTKRRNRAKMSPPGMKPMAMPTVPEQYKAEYDLHLIKLLSGHFGVTMSELGFTESQGLGNSGLHDGQADVEQRVGQRPDEKMIAEMINELSHDFLRCPPEVCFSFTQDDAEDTMDQDTVRKQQRERGTITLNDDRRAIGMAPLNVPEGDMPMVYVGTGWLPVEGMAAAAQQKVEAEQALVDDQLATGEQGREIADQQATMEAEELSGADAAKALELDAYRRWARKGRTRGRAFVCKALEPSDFPGEDVPADVDFELWAWVAEEDVDKALGGHDGWRRQSRDSKGRWVKLGHMRADSLGPVTPGKEVLSGLARQAASRRAPATSGAVDVTGGSSAADKLRRAETMHGSDRSKWPAKVRQDAARLEAQQPSSDRTRHVDNASTTLDTMTTPNAPKLTPAQAKTLATMRANPDQPWGRDTARQADGFNVNSLNALERAGLVEFYDNPDSDAPSHKQRLVRVKGDAAPTSASSEDTGLGSLKLTSAQAMTPEGQRYGAAKIEHAEARALFSRVEGHATASVDRPKFRARLDAATAELRAAQDALTGRPDGYTSEGDRMAALDAIDNADVDVPASRARFGRKAPADVTPDQQDASVRDVVTSLQDAPGGWVSMVDVRAALQRKHGMDRGQQDAAIRRLMTTGDRALNAAPEDNQKTLSDADHAAAIDLGAGPQHVLSLDPPRPVIAPLRGDDDVMDLIEDLGQAGDGYVSLEVLRQRMGGTPEEQTAALKRMDRARLIALDPDPLRSTMPQVRRDAAIEIGGEPKHLARLMGSRTPKPAEQTAASAVIDSVPGLREGVARQQRYGRNGERSAEQEAARLDAVAAKWDRVVRAPGDGTRDAMARNNADYARSEAARIRSGTSADDPELTTVREGQPTPGFAIPTTPPVTPTPDPTPVSADTAGQAAPTARSVTGIDSAPMERQAALRETARKLDERHAAFFESNRAELERDIASERAYLERTDLDEHERRQHETMLTSLETLKRTPRGDAAVQATKAARELIELADAQGMIVMVSHSSSSGAGGGSPYFDVQAVSPDMKNGFKATFHTFKGNRDTGYGRMRSEVLANGRWKDASLTAIREHVQRANTPEPTVETAAPRNVDPSMKVSRDEVQVGDWRWNDGMGHWEQIGMIADRPDAVGSRTIWGMDRETRLGAIPRDTQTIVARQAERPALPPRAAGLKGLQRKAGEPAKRGDVYVVERTDRNNIGGRAHQDRKSYEVYEVTSVTREGKPRKVRRMTDAPGEHEQSMDQFGSLGRTLGYGTSSLVPGDRIDKEGLAADLRARTYKGSTTPRAHDDLRELGDVLYGRMKPTV